MFKKIIASLILAAPAAAQTLPGVEQHIGCTGLHPFDRQETLTVFKNGPTAHRFLSSGENPNSWGFLWYGYQSANVFGPGMFGPVHPTTGLCITPTSGRTVPYQSNSFGVASVVIPGMNAFPGTWSFQRIHRESVLGAGSFASGPGITAVIL